MFHFHQIFLSYSRSIAIWDTKYNFLFQPLQLVRQLLSCYWYRPLYNLYFKLSYKMALFVYGLFLFLF